MEKYTIKLEPFPHLYIDNFIPSKALVRAAAESFKDIDTWVKYQGKSMHQIQNCSRLGRENVPPPALTVLDYIATNFDPDRTFGNPSGTSFPDFSHYGGGAMVTPNSRGEGGYLGMHIDASSHGVQPTWKREYSVILGVSEEYDSSFDLLLHDGNKTHARVPYKFNRLWAFKCSENSYHGVNRITEGLDRKTLGVMYWSIGDGKSTHIKAKFNNDLRFD